MLLLCCAFIGANPSTTLWGSVEMALPERPKSEARRYDRRGVGFLRDVPLLPSQPARGLRERCKLSYAVGSGKKARRPWRFRTFYRLTKPLLVSILLILNLFQCNFPGDPSHRRPYNQVFVGVRTRRSDHHGIGAYV